MNYGPDGEPTPLRSRLGPHADDLWQRRVGSPRDDDVFAPDPGPEVPSPGPTSVSPTVESGEKLNALATQTPAPSSRRTALDSAIEQTSDRVGHWISEQQQRLSVGLDSLLAQLAEHREEALARMRDWEAAERKRVETELAAEQDHFHERLMAELKAFEEQLALRLAEQEERLGRWLAEAEAQAKQRFAERLAP